MTTTVFFFALVFVSALSAFGGEHYEYGPRIKGGEIAKITEYPYQALLTIENSKSICGGSIIGQWYILTAGHCVKGVDVHKIKLRIGSPYRLEGGQVHSISDSFVHPDYNKDTLDYDVAVLKTSSKIKYDYDLTRPVRLADYGSPVPDKILVSGWSETEEQTESLLRAVILPVVKCTPSPKYTDRMFCAGDPNGNNATCTGDSGGPAVDVDTLVQYGIVSKGGCGDEEFGVYISVPAVREWIGRVSGITYNYVV